MKSFPDDDPVFFLQGDDIRNGGEGSKIQPLFHTRHPLKGLADFERHARTAQIGAGVFSQKRIHHHVSLGENFRRLVMVCHDDGQTKGLRQGNFFHIGDTAVHCNQNLSFFRYFTDSIGIQAVAFGVTGRNAVCQGRAFLVQGFHQDGGSADAVCVIVAVNEDGFSFINGLPEQGNGFRHAREQERVMEIIQ